jgi:hypothetical protein
MDEYIYIIFDKNAGIGLKPLIVSRNHVAPLREVQDLCNNKETLLYKHAGDFQLVKIGVLNLETLEIIRHTPEVIANCIDLVEQPE